MKPDVLVVGPMYAPTIELLDSEFNTHKLWLAPDRHAFLAGCAESVRGMALWSPHGADAALIGALPHLEIIACMGVGVDAVDLAAARGRGIIVTNTPEVLNDCVADLALGLILAGARRIPQGDRYVRQGRWLAAPMALARHVSGKRLGILGFGRIGQAIARRAAGFDLRIAYHNRRPVPGSPFPYHARAVDLARDSDFLVVVVPGGKETQHLVDEEVIRAVGPEGLLVNVARGSVVDEAALVRCLREGALGAAALDVFADEPNVPEALLSMENVVLQPHVGSATHETRAAMGRLTVDNLIAHFAGRAPLTPVP